MNNRHTLLTYPFIFVSKISINQSLLFQVLVSNSSAQLLVSNEYFAEQESFHHSDELLPTYSCKRLQYCQFIVFRFMAYIMVLNCLLINI